MTIKKREFFIWAIIIIVLLFGMYSYPNLPNRVPTHWNINGEVDGWANKNFAVYFFPGLILAIYLLMAFLPYIDPFKENYKKFDKYYFWFKLGLVLFLSALYKFTILAGLGCKMNITYFIVPLMSIGMILLGLFLPKLKRNYFIGIRTPWTIASDKVWDSAHKFAGPVFIAFGVLPLLLFWFVSSAVSFWIFMFSVSSAGIITVVHSYFEFRKLK